MILQKLFEKLWFTFYGIVTCLLDALNDFLELAKKNYNMSKRHKSRKKKHKTHVIMNGYDYDDRMTDYYEKIYGGIVKTDSTNSKQSTKNNKKKDKSVEKVIPDFELAPVQELEPET